jgi:hypothetical protein
VLQRKILIILLKEIWKLRGFRRVLEKGKLLVYLGGGGRGGGECQTYITKILRNEKVEKKK